jgi:hypothetical protein
MGWGQERKGRREECGDDVGEVRQQAGRASNYTSIE